MDRNALRNIAMRLNIYDESTLKKSEEYLRTYHSKGIIKNLNDQAKVVLCLNLAAIYSGKGFDKDMALTISGLKKLTYQNNLHTLEKILEINKIVSVSDVCVLLGCMSVKDDAEEILSRYMNCCNKIGDFEHPQYIAAATYLACKAKHVQIEKPKIISISRLRPSQWKELLGEFKALGFEKKSITHKIQENIEQESDGKEIENQLSKKDEVEEVEDYEVWRKRILEEAYAALGSRRESMEQ